MGRVTLTALAVAIALSACSEQTENVPVDAKLAIVNGEAIYQSEMDAAWSRTFSDMDALYADEAMEERLLKSLVGSRVMARKAEAQMTDEQKRELNAVVKAWREEQLVKRYLAENVTPEPVTTEMVESYYAKHPELFGGGERRLYEVLRIENTTDETRRDVAVGVLGKAANEKDWQQYARAQSNAELIVSYERARADSTTQDKALLAKLKSLQAGQASALSLAGGVATVMRVSAVETVAPKPLIEVRNDIRRRLAPVNLKAAVKEAMDSALLDANVEYIDNTDRRN